MPKTTKRTSKRKIVKTDFQTENFTNQNSDFTMPKTNSFNYKRAIIIVLVIGIAFLAWQKFKGVIIAGTVNGKPIFKMELTQRLSSQYGSQVLDALIGEKLILEEAAKQKIIITKDEVDSKLKEVESSLQGMSLDEALKAQNMTKDDLLNRIKMQLTIDKMFNKEISVSATEITDFVKNNSTYLTSTDSAEQLVEAEKQIISSKIEQKFTEWFTKAKEAAKILKFL